MVSSASSITAHCLGVRALASSRPMCSCRTNQTEESVNSSYLCCSVTVAALYPLYHLELRKLAQLLSSIEDQLGALWRRRRTHRHMSTVKGTFRRSGGLWSGRWVQEVKWEQAAANTRNEFEEWTAKESNYSRYAKLCFLIMWTWVKTNWKIYFACVTLSPVHCAAKIKF